MGRVSVCHIKIILEPPFAVRVVEHGNAAGSLIYPSPKAAVPFVQFQHCGGIRALGVNQNLFLKGTFIVEASRAEEACPFRIAAGNTVQCFFV